MMKNPARNCSADSKNNGAAGGLSLKLKPMTQMSPVVPQRERCAQGYHTSSRHLDNKATVVVEISPKSLFYQLSPASLR